jgi:hypothetical protein
MEKLLQKNKLKNRPKPIVLKNAKIIDGFLYDLHNGIGALPTSCPVALMDGRITIKEMNNAGNLTMVEQEMVLAGILNIRGI